MQLNIEKDKLFKTILRLEWLTTCSDLEMQDGDKARDVIEEILPSLKELYIYLVKIKNLEGKI